MATKADGARPASSVETCAMNGFVQPTPRTMVRGFTLLKSNAETHVTARGDVVPWVAIDNNGDAGAPIVNDATFWLASTVKTVRFS